jgi:tRNA uridine 5-carboxymethylaminomethyl modification enzyme
MFKILSRPQINLEDMMKLEKWKSITANDNNLIKNFRASEFRLRSTQGTLKSNADKLKRLEDVKIPDDLITTILNQCLLNETN